MFSLENEAHGEEAGIEACSVTEIHPILQYKAHSGMSLHAYPLHSSSFISSPFVSTLRYYWLGVFPPTQNMAVIGFRVETLESGGGDRVGGVGGGK